MLRHLRNNGTTAMFLGFFVMSCVFAYCPFFVKIAAASAFFVCFVLLRFKKLADRVTRGDRLLKRGLSLLCAAVAVAGVFSACTFDLFFAYTDSASGKSETARFYISGVEKEYSYLTLYRAETVDSDLIPNGCEVILTSEYSGIETGTYLDADVTYRSLHDSDSAYFDGMRYYLPRGVMIFADSEDCEFVELKQRFGVKQFFGDIRTRLSSAIRAHCGNGTGELASAVLLGDRTGLDKSAVRDFRRLGISHLLVISGTHFSAFITLLDYLLRRLKRRPKERAAVCICFTVLFMCITGFTPSVVRAGIMHLLAEISVLIMRKPNNETAYALSGAVLVAVSPFSVLDIGLQLSYTATFACIVYLSCRSKIRSRLFGRRKKTEEKRLLLRRLADGVFDGIFLTFAVQMYTLPLSWLYFGEISLFSIPANIVAIPLVSVLMYLSAVYIITYPLTVLIFPLSRLIEGYTGLVMKLFGFFSRIKGITVSVDYRFTVFFVVPLAVLLVILPLTKRKHITAALASAVFVVFLATVIVAGSVVSSSDKISYVPDGKNDGLVVRSGGKILVADMSTGGFGYSYSLTSEARRLNVTETDAVLLTHYHNRHIRFFGSLCERETVSTLVLPSPMNENEELICLALCETAEEYGIEVVVIEPDEEYLFGDVYVNILPRVYLSRTTHPISGITVKEQGGEEYTLVSSSWNDGGDEYLSAVGNADFVFFGEHSPVYKNKFDLSLSPDVKTVVGGESFYRFLQPESAEKYASVFTKREAEN